MKRFLCAIITTAMLFALVPANKTNAEVDVEQYTARVLELVNETRANVGVSPLTGHKTLNALACFRAKELAESFSHTRPDGTICSTVMAEFGVSAGTWGENIAYGYDTPETVMDAWIKSEGHYENLIKSDFSEIGIGVYVEDGAIFWTQFFVGRAVIPDDVEPQPIKGDIDSSGKVELNDVMLMKKHIFSLSILTQAQAEIADINGDSTVNAADLCAIMTIIGNAEQ